VLWAWVLVRPWKLKLFLVLVLIEIDTLMLYLNWSLRVLTQCLESHLPQNNSRQKVGIGIGCVRESESPAPKFSFCCSYRNRSSIVYQQARKRTCQRTCALLTVTEDYSSITTSLPSYDAFRGAELSREASISSDAGCSGSEALPNINSSQKNNFLTVRYGERLPLLRQCYVSIRKQRTVLLNTTTTKMLEFSDGFT